MGKTDGKVVLSTGLNNAGFKKDAKGIKNAVSDVNSAMKSLASNIAAAFGVAAIAKFSKQASESATETESSVQRLVDIYGSASEALGDYIDENARAMGMSKTAAAGFSAVYGNLFSVWADQQQNAALTTKYLNMTAVVASKTGRTVEDVQERVRSGLLGNTEAIEDLGIFVNVKTIEITDAFQKIADGRSWEQLSAYEQQQVRTMAILEQATQKYGEEVANTTALTKSQYHAAYADFEATWGQVVNVVLVPVLQVLVQIFSIATAGLQRIFGLSSKTVQSSEQYGDNIKSATSNQSDLTKEVAATGKAAQKALAGFDEIQKLGSDAGGGGGGAVSGAGSEINLGDFGIGELEAGDGGASQVSGISANLAAIMDEIGIALAAVGLILIFSGQIAWGAGFVIAGAAMFTVAMAAVAGDTVSPIVITALASIMGVIGGALVAIGVILIMVGSTAMGIGFIIAGAAKVGASVATIAIFSTDPIKDTLLAVEAIAGGAMLALGILLLYFGVNKPLAIGLIVAGAAVLAVAVAQIVAGAVSEEVAGWIYAITAIVSAALLVIGIIMLATGHITPLSIGLLIAGAAGLATTAAINWNSIVDALRGKIGIIVAIVSGALLALGIILLFVPGAQGLGLGLLIAGAAGLATVVAFNWSSILDSIKKVWNDIKAFWNRYIAVVFTAQFWTDLAKICGNGLIAGFEAAVNGVISLFESLINFAVDGLNGLIGGLSSLTSAAGELIGVDLSIPKIPRASLGRVSIPRLAEGAVIPPNREFMAILGDQKHGTNIEAPLSTIQEAVAAVMQDYVSANMAGHEATVSVLQEILEAVLGIQIGDDVIAAAVNRYNRKMAVMRGG